MKNLILILLALSLSACNTEATQSADTQAATATQSQMKNAKANATAFYSKKWKVSDDMRGALRKCDNTLNFRKQVICTGIQPDFGGVFITTQIKCSVTAKTECKGV